MLVSLHSGRAIHSCSSQAVRAPKEPQKRRHSGEEAGDTPVRERMRVSTLPVHFMSTLDILPARR